ncbi:hypothetical protein Runsl_3493 [Runella slithyformis DSM 19594]|uniref:Uncharacterized protein n=1 Tax=Runella slithyformis (strain ATCC 29530 / DSM 19594 / LMG 11500 / NCIMB 11436 / LSU 4) TaxID=761193 RepID=A0A7U3ZMC1_RUNSL|nr:hypothetical protein Runsl_3493 [Runella slithyformis DSM 19594]
MGPEKFVLDRAKRQGLYEGRKEEIEQVSKKGWK